MDWQQASALGIVALTVALFIAGRFRKRKGTACGCGCASASGTPDKSSVILRARKGERRQVIVKMR